MKLTNLLETKIGNDSMMQWPQDYAMTLISLAETLLLCIGVYSHLLILSWYVLEIKSICKLILLFLKISIHSWKKELNQTKMLMIPNLFL